MSYTAELCRLLLRRKENRLSHRPLKERLQFCPLLLVCNEIGFCFRLLFPSTSVSLFINIKKKSERKIVDSTTGYLVVVFRPGF